MQARQKGTERAGTEGPGAVGVLCVPMPPSGSVADRRIPQMEAGGKTNMGDLNRKEEAIRWLTQELRSLRLAPDINGCDMQPHWQEQIDILETCLEAVRACHIGDTSKMVPLAQADIETMHFRAGLDRLWRGQRGWSCPLWQTILHRYPRWSRF